MSAAAVVEDVVADVRAAHPGHQMRIFGGQWHAVCTGAGCQWSRRVPWPWTDDKEYHRAHVAREVATASGLGAGA